MDENTLLRQLEELAESLKVEVRYESFKSEGSFSTGGLCKLKGEYLLIVNSKAAVREKAEAIAGALKRFDLSQVYLRPGLREFLDAFGETAKSGLKSNPEGSCHGQRPDFSAVNFDRMRRSLMHHPRLWPSPSTER